MTREEAISEWTFRSKHIKKWLDEYGEEPSIRHYVELIDMAIEALKAEAEPKWNYTANFVAEQLDRLRNMTDEERREFFKRFFGMSDDAAFLGNLISREKAMQSHPEYLNEYINDEPRPYAKGWNDATKEYWTALSSIPSAEVVSREFYEDAVKANHGLAKENSELKAQIESAETEWIPCSERLPNESGDYICTIPLDAEETYTEVLTFHKGRFYEDDDEWGATYHDDVLAWMPLPEPYKGGDAE